MKLAKTALIETLRTLPDVVASYFENIPEDALDVRRLPTAWTLREHLYHICGIQDMLLKRLRLMLHERQPVITPYFPDQETEKLNQFASVVQALDRYREIRKEQLAVFAQADDEIFSRAASHPEYHQYSMGVLLHHMVFHEHWHLYRIEELWLTKDEFLTEM